MKKILQIVALIIISPLASWSQGIAELIEMHTLYRGYPNSILIGSNGGEENLDLKCTNCEIERSGEAYIVKPGNNRTVTIEIVSADNGKVLLTKEAVVKNLPNADLYLNGSSSGRTISEVGKVLNAKYPSGATLNCDFEVQKWTLSCNNTEVKGEGTLLSDNAIALLNSTKNGETFTIVAKVKRCDNTSQTLSGTWTYQGADFHEYIDPTYPGFVTIIDKTTETKSIFDYNDPFSLVSLVSNNPLLHIRGLDPVALNRIKKENPSIDLPDYEYRGVDMNPLLDEDTESSGFGEPLIVISEDGAAEYVYSDDVQRFYDVHDITKLIIYEDTLEHEVTGEKYFGIEKIGFAKKYPGSKKYDVVFTLPYTYLVKSDAFKALVKLDAKETKMIVSDTSSFYFEINKFLPESGQFNIPKKLKEMAYEEMVYGMSNDEFHYLDVMPSDGSNALWNNYRVPNIKDYSNSVHQITIGSVHAQLFPFDYPENEDVINQYKCEYEIYKSDDPLIDGDVTSPNFGEPLVEINELTGEETFVYPADEIEISYVYNKNPTIYLLYDFMYNDRLVGNQNNVYLEAIYFTAPMPGGDGEFCTLKYDLYKKADDRGRYGINMTFQKSIGPYVMKDYTNTIPWRIQLGMEKEKATKYNATSQKDVKELSKTFNLEGYPGIALNLLGVVLE
ncbi:MAG: GldM family protein [Crocinitomix sp.]|nr:GldM family protein [Crocinitomix sp.]